MNIILNGLVLVNTGQQWLALTTTSSTTTTTTTATTTTTTATTSYLHIFNFHCPYTGV